MAKEVIENQLKINFYSQIIADGERTSLGEVIPVIGGMVYDHLGFQGQEEKNRYILEIVKSRRSKLIKV